jgi:hypothetical protein
MCKAISSVLATLWKQLNGGLYAVRAILGKRCTVRSQDQPLVGRLALADNLKAGHKSLKNMTIFLNREKQTFGKSRRTAGGNGMT